eukprot:530176_1
MQSTSLFRDVNYSGDSDSSTSDDEDDIFTSPGYISLKRIPQQMKQAQPSWAMNERLQRSNSYANPKYFNPNQKKASMNKLQRKRRTKMATKLYISLFPKIDLLIWYFPTYILRNRPNKCKHYTILIICIFAILWTIYCQCYTVIKIFFNKNTSTFNITRG